MFWYLEANLSAACNPLQETELTQVQYLALKQPEKFRGAGSTQQTESTESDRRNGAQAVLINSDAASWNFMAQPEPGANVAFSTREKLVR